MVHKSKPLGLIIYVIKTTKTRTSNKVVTSMDNEYVEVDPIERWFILAPMGLLVFAWLQLNLILLGYHTSIFSALALFAISFFLVQRFYPKATSKNKSSHVVLFTLLTVIIICEFLRPATSYPVQYDAAYHILQASTYADILDFDAFNRIFRPPLLPVLLSATLVFDEGGSLSLVLMRLIVLLFGLQTYVLAKKLGASTIPATIFAAAAITSPIAIDWGARYYHGIFAAMLATMVLNLLLNIDWKKCSPVLIVFIGFSSGGVALARYSFSYLLGIIGFTGLMSKKIQPMLWFILAWAIAVLPFMLNDWNETGDLLASLRPQIDAPVDRALDPVEGVGWSSETFSVWGYLDFRGELLSDGISILALCGFGLMIQKKKWNQLAIISAVVIPHVMIYSLLLGYGEARYMVLVVPLGCALAACGFDPVVNWAKQLINPRPQSLTSKPDFDDTAQDYVLLNQTRFDSAAHPALSVMVILLTVFAPFVDHLIETNEYHSRTNEWVDMLRSVADEVPDDATIVASSKDLQMMWLGREISKEPPHAFESLRSWMDSEDASHIITRNRGSPEPCARDVTLCIEAPWLNPVAALSESNGWMILWEFDDSAGEYQPSDLSIEPFVKVNEQWRGHEEGTTDLIRNNLLVVRHYDDVVTLNPEFIDAKSIEIDIAVFRFDAWPDAAIDLESGEFDNLEADDRFYAASWNNTTFVHSGPYVDQNSLPVSLTEAYTFSPSDYGRGGASGVHYVRLRAIYE
jgi:hypothetical protein